jgi:hypothetical protein
LVLSVLSNKLNVKSAVGMMHRLRKEFVFLI